ncbi:MAG: hypothetical protein MRY83_17945, partial [Flavobacteriales bacterium]|nr:hypothetical protein [Flavobacteriales bacterium]
MNHYLNHALIACALFLNTTILKSQQLNYNLPTDPSNQINIPPSPSAGELGKFGDFPVSLATGKPDITIPIHTLKSGGLSLPVILRYQSDGIKVNDKASWTGLGWILEAGGVITRNVKGIADEKPKGYLNQGIPDANAIIPANNHQYVIDVTRGKHDNQADVFHLNIPGLNGKFMFQQDGSVQMMPYNPEIKVSYNITGGSITDFEVIDANGNTYIFDQAEKTNATNYLIDAGTPTTAWYLSEIIAHNGLDKIQLDYYNHGDRHFDIPDVETHYLKFISPTSPNQYSSEVKKSFDKGDYTVQNMRRISSIHSNYGRIDFDHSAGNRLDDPSDNDVRLDAIKIYDAHG